MATETLRLMIVAGEPSGDAHAAALVEALRQVAPKAQFEFFGSTGALMRQAGVESVVCSDHLALHEFVEEVRALPKFWRAFRALKRAGVQRRPDAAILVDWPDFNLRLAHALRRLSIRVIYYVSPQLWAWRSYRVRNIRRDVDLLLSILPFEAEWFNRRGIKHVEFVGHPMTGEVSPRYGREEFCRRHGLDPSRSIIALLPGSRHQEFVRILPPMLDAAVRISRIRRDSQFVLVVAPNRSPEEADRIITAGNYDSLLGDSLRIMHHETPEALAAADVAAVASGTATLETAIIGTPLVVVYRASRLNWHVLRRLINAEHYGLINLIADERLAAELMQNQLNGPQLAAELLALLDHDRNREMRARLRQATERLGRGGASRRAAEAVLRALREWNSERLAAQASNRGPQRGSRPGVAGPAARRHRLA